MMKNPVMFVVEVGSVVTTLLLFRERQSFAFNLQITLWLWFTVLFATSLKPWPKAAARRKPTRCGKPALKPKPNDSCRVGRQKRS